MRNVLFIYRVLLPPLFIFGFGSARPPERGQKQLLNSLGIVESSVLNSSLVSEDMLNVVDAFEVPDLTSFDARVSEKHGTMKSRVIQSSNSLKTSLKQHIPPRPHFVRGAQINKRTRKNEGPNPLLPNSAHRLTGSLIHDDLGLVSSGANKPRTLQPEQLSTSRRRRSRRSASSEWSLSKLKLRPPEQTPPEYMVHLYNLLAGTHYELLMNTVVTSFVNINAEDADASLPPPESHIIVFNVSLDKQDESIRYAELRVFIVLRNSTNETDPDVNTTLAIAGQINVYEVEDPYSEYSKKSRLVSSKMVHVLNGAWESFNVSSVVQSWPSDGLKVFQVKILELPGGNMNSSSGDIVTHKVMDIDEALGKDPLLVVFSKKTSSREVVPHMMEKRDTRQTSDPLESLLNSQAAMPYELVNNNEIVNASHYFQGLVSAVQSMAYLTNSHADPLQRFPADPKRQVLPTNDMKMYVSNDSNYNFTFQNTDPVVKSLSQNQNQRPWGISPLKNGLNESLKSVLGPMEIKPNPDEEAPDNVLIGRIRRQTKTRYRRHLDSLFASDQVRQAIGRVKRSKKKRNGCRRQELYVNFKQILWDNVILIPDGYSAFECVGKCTYPMSDHLTPTKHAIVQTLLHTNYPQLAHRACCVPTKLKPISVIYNDNGNIRFDYTYDGMVVAECGCR